MFILLQLVQQLVEWKYVGRQCIRVVVNDTKYEHDNLPWKQQDF